MRRRSVGWNINGMCSSRELTFADADSILGMLRELCPHLVDGLLPVWVRNLAYRLVLLQRPDEPTLLREAAQNLWLHGPDWDDLAADLLKRADELDGGSTAGQREGDSTADGLEGGSTADELEGDPPTDELDGGSAADKLGG